MRSTLYTLLIAFVLGGLSGILGTAWTSSYLADYAWKLNQLTAPLGLSQERPRHFPSSYKEAVDRLIQSSLPSVAQVYRGTAGPLGFTGEPDATAVVLTSDGWLAIHVEPNDTRNMASASVLIGGRAYPVKETVFDATSRVLFLHVEAMGLPVAAFGKGRDTQLGEQVFVTHDDQAFEMTTVQHHIWPIGTVVFSETPNRLLMLTDAVEAGDIVFNLNGEMIGFVEANHRVLPFENVLPAFRSLLEQKKIVRPFLGVQYVDLAHAVNLPQTLSRTLHTGALLYGAGAVQKGSPAKLAGLQVNDIVLSVNGESVNVARGLDELVLQYRPGDVVQVLIDRAGAQQTLSVTLGELKE